MTIDVTKIIPLRDDVVLRLKPIQKATNSVIYFTEELDHTTLQYFTVLRTGPDVKHLKTGDVVVASWKRITEPFEVEIDGVRCKVGITSEVEVDCIVEG